VKRITVWIKYESKGEYEIEVPDDFEVPDTFADWPDEWIAACDENAREQSPMDWGYRDAD
jgi:hypothetical protein